MAECSLGVVPVLVGFGILDLLRLIGSGGWVSWFEGFVFLVFVALGLRIDGFSWCS